eukprot:6025429-Amphidinium_carterae.1
MEFPVERRSSTTVDDGRVKQNAVKDADCESGALRAMLLNKSEQHPFSLRMAADIYSCVIAGRFSRATWFRSFQARPRQ